MVSGDRMQLAINVQIPVKLGGVGGHAIYIDTEGSFMLERALQMTKASIDELVIASSLSSPMDDDLIQQLDIDTYLSHIYLVRVHDPTEQLAVINNLPNLLKEHNQVKLIVIDSITFNFRQDFEDMAGRTRLLAEMGQKLGKIAEEHDLAVWCPPTPFIHSRVHNNLLLLSLYSYWFFCCIKPILQAFLPVQ
jgi:RAD51-like protein 2